MSNVRTAITIAAPPERVWAVLTDFAAYPQWNQIISRVRADLRQGGAIKFKIRMIDAPELGFAAKIVRFAPGRELAWRGGAPVLPALAWGEHYFRVTAKDGGSELVHGEDFGGLLTLIMRGSAHARVTRTYDSFNRALKARVEADAAA